MRYYVGRNRESGRLQLLYCGSEPTEASYGGAYSYSIGPFKTKRAAVWAVKHGDNNPHFQHVMDAERIARVNE